MLNRDTSTRERRMTDFSKLSAYGRLKIIRETDGAILGFVTIQLKQGAVVISAAYRTSPGQESDVPDLDDSIKCECSNFKTLEDAIVWVQANPFLPDPTLTDADLMRTGHGLVRRVWRTPNGCAIAVPAAGTRIRHDETPRWALVVAVLLDPHNGVIGYVRFSSRGENWYVNDFERDGGLHGVRRAASFERAMERLVAAGLAYHNTPSAHEKLEVADSRAERLEIFRQAMAERYSDLISYVQPSGSRRADTGMTTAG